MPVSVVRGTILTGGGSASGGAFTGWVLPDSNGILWNITINTSGNFIRTIVTAPPSGSLYRNSIVMQDSGSTFWQITVDTTGHFNINTVGDFTMWIKDFLMNDSSGYTWIITIDTSGHLIRT